MRALCSGVALVILLLFFQGCSATATSDRFGKYRTDSTSSNPGIMESTLLLRLPSTMSLPAEPVLHSGNASQSGENYWVTFNDEPLNRIDNNKIKRNGFRVLVKTTRNGDEADSLRSYLYFISGRQSSYVDYDPPLYKIKLGDYQKQSAARDAQFFVSQLGFKNAIVISDSIFVTAHQ